MTDWDDALAELRREFLQTAPARLQHLTALIDAAERSPHDVDARSELRRAFHGLAGSGATYGFAEVSRLSERAEDECAETLDGPPPSAGDVARWRDVVAVLRERLTGTNAGVDAVPDEPPPATADAPRILSVEDDPDYAAYVNTLLTAAGYAVRVCADPRAFERELLSFKPDLVLMDVLLPGATGYDLGRLLRQNESYATLPVLYLTTEQHLRARLDGIASGADDYLIKGDPPALLLATIAVRLQRARLLKQLVERDGHTNLLTHTVFVRRVSEVIALHRRDPARPASLVMIDVDYFKQVNDRYGHPVGDQVLAALAALLRSRLRQSDIIGRYGGEEFAMVLPDVDGAQAVQLVTRLLEEFARVGHRGRGDTVFHVTFSAGVAALHAGTIYAERWIAEADAALYAAKAAGRNRVLAGYPEP